MPLWESVLWQNRVSAWVAALALAVGLAALLLLARGLTVRWLRRLAERSRTRAADLTVTLAGRTHVLFLLALAVYAGAALLTLPGRVERVLTVTLLVAFLVQVALWGTTLISLLVSQYVQRAAEDAVAATTATAFGFFGRLLLWVVVALLALDNLGVDITTLVAGLGVGGIAVALAVQNILGDLFASFSIVFDKPFSIGDFIAVGDFLGTVEHVGLKTTRVRSLSGEQIIFSNSDLLQSRIRNYKRMAERRVVFTLGVTYETPYEELRAIPGIVRQVIEGQAQARFDRAHFKAYGDFSLVYEAVYYLPTPDYTAYMDTQQAINLEIYRRFKERGIAFAYPTQTLYLRGAAPAAVVT
ncbi:MAG: mechanosensitive ion channel family protein [Armatimonadota bacterium]|nr:mechanosensitive ion channel family protein [Armatimonadota bacterium]